jgi:hypothetical protein
MSQRGRWDGRRRSPPRYIRAGPPIPMARRSHLPWALFIILRSQQKAAATPLYTASTPLYSAGIPSYTCQTDLSS